MDRADAQAELHAMFERGEIDLPRARAILEAVEPPDPLISELLDRDISNAIEVIMQRRPTRNTGSSAKVPGGTSKAQSEGGIIAVELDWPDKRLSPNSRVCWAAKLSPKEKARDDAFEKVRQLCASFNAEPPYQAVVTFRPPDKRHRDLDNLYSSCKPKQDGICRALGIDDSQIRRVVLEWGEVVKGGKVTVTIQPMEGK